MANLDANGSILTPAMLEMLAKGNCEFVVSKLTQERLLEDVCLTKTEPATGTAHIFEFGGLPVQVDTAMPNDRIDLRSKEGSLLGRIINIGEPHGLAE